MWIAAAAPPTVGIEAVLPVWVLIVTAAASAIVTAYAAAQIVKKIVVQPTQRTVVALRTEVRSWMETTDIVNEHAPRWDKGLSELANAVQKLADVTATLGNVQGDIAIIKEQVTIDHGESLKDRLIKLGERGDERHGRVDERFEALERHLQRQDAAHGQDADDLDDHLDAQDATHDATHEPPERL